MNELSPEKQRLLNTNGYILASGGPGCGKTFISLHKAEALIKGKEIKPGQKILFLSFARATIARVAKQAQKALTPEVMSYIEINTYHGFIWNILRSHGYLLTDCYPIRLLPPHEATSLFSELELDKRDSEKHRVFKEKGLLHFDLFAVKCAELLNRSKALHQIICDSYPHIIVDEFQDTNNDEWALIKTLGQKCNIIALADPEQRIYEFRGANPNRIQEYIDQFNPQIFDFSIENHRSNGTDILTFGNDLLTGINKKKHYCDVAISKYEIRSGISRHIELKTTVLKRKKHLSHVKNEDWSIAILVPTKKIMLEVSDYLLERQIFTDGKTLPTINHDVSLDNEGPALAAVVIASILEGNQSNIQDYSITELLGNIIEHIRGRNGNKLISKADLELTKALFQSIQTGKVRGSKRKELVDECWRIVEKRQNIVFTGNPYEDWLTVRNFFEESKNEKIHKVYQDAKFLRLLRKGTQLRSTLSELWRINGSYSGAVNGVKNALIQEHFSSATKDWNGINIMTIHKSKGKEFDEVIIYEGQFSDRIVRENLTQNELNQATYALRVAVTRAISRATIITPFYSPCPLLV